MSDAGGFFGRLKQGLSRSASHLGSGLKDLFTKRKLDREALEELEEVLIAADLGPAVAARVVGHLADSKFDKEVDPADVRAALRDVVAQVLQPVAKPLHIDDGNKPHVVLVVGVNGTGKTTTIGKIAYQLKSVGKKVTLAAGDTFRAAAIEQLQIWGERAGADVVAGAVGADPASIAFTAMERAKSNGSDVLLIDTAGRLHNKDDLMAELAKILRVIGKHDETAPHDVLLVLDATTGQNALRQVEVFSQVAGVTGLVMTKLDGTARGGVLVAIAEKQPLPVHFLGVGESVDDLHPFEAESFAQALAGLD